MAFGPFCSVERNNFGNFGRWSPKNNFCEIILNSGHWPRICRLKFFCFFLLFFFSSGGHFVQRSGTILAILVEGHKRNKSVKLFSNRVIGLERDVV